MREIPYDRIPSWSGVHTFDALDRPLSSYVYATERFIHIEGIRVW